MAEKNLTSDSLTTPLEHTVRLLYPFWIDAGNLDKAVRALGLQHAAGRGRELKTWREAERIPELYRSETLPLVTQVLFGIRSGTNRYLCVERGTLDHWFPKNGIFAAKPAAPGVDKTQGRAEQTAFSIAVAGEGIELFLSPHGVGLLVMTFDCPKLGGLASLTACNFHLSQLREPAAWHYQTPNDPNSPNPKPAADVAFEQRLGHGGGAFGFQELVDFLLAPLGTFGLQSTQRQFSVYSVSRLTPSELFTEADGIATLRPFLAALAQVEKTSDNSSVGAGERRLDAQHWAAVSSQGTAHLLADPGKPDSSGQQNSLYAYFVPYLCALLQRLTLQRMLWETDRAVLDAEDRLQDQQAKLRTLRQDMLSFSVQYSFTEVSNREAHNQYYELALDSLRVTPTRRQVQRVLRDMESAAAAAFQQESAQDRRQLAHDAGHTADLMADIHRKLEWLEVIFVSYFASILVNYVGDGYFTDAYAHWSLVATPLLSGLIGLACIKPYKTQPASINISMDEGNKSKHRHKGSWVFLTLLSGIFLAWVAVGWQCYSAESEGYNGQLCSNATDCGPESRGTI